MKQRYIRVADKKFMMISQLEEEILLFEIEMLERNSTKRLLPVSMVISDGRAELWYDITNLQPLESWFRFKNITADLLEEMLESVVLAHYEVSEYLLLMDSLVLNSSMIFVNMETNQHFFCYLPGQNVEAFYQKNTISGLLESMLTMIDFQNKELVSSIYHMLETMQQTDGSYQSLQQCLLKEKEKKTKNLPPVCIEESQPAQRKEGKVREIMVRKRDQIIEDLSNKWKEWTDWSIVFQNPLFNKKKKLWSIGSRERNHGKPSAILFDEENHEMDLQKPVNSMDLDQEYGVVGELVYLGELGYPPIEVGNEKITIGNNDKIADVVIADATISKIHALIEYIGGEYFLEDLNSVYGTFLNGERLEYRERRKLLSEDVVHFAKAKYRFH